MATREELQNLARIVEVTKASFDEVEKQLSKIEDVLIEHDITLATLNELITVAAKGSASAFLSIGSGVTIPYKHQGTQEGLVMIDLGSGIFGEKPWSEAVAITKKRKEDIAVLRDQLQTQAQQLETKIGEAAEQFNQMAMAMKPEANQNKLSLSPAAQQQESATTESDKTATQPKTRRAGKRRSGMFGNELTLDD